MLHMLHIVIKQLWLRQKCCVLAQRHRAAAAACRQPLSECRHKPALTPLLRATHKLNLIEVLHHNMSSCIERNMLLSGNTVNAEKQLMQLTGLLASA